MPLKTYQVLIIVFIIGLGWEFYSDLIFSSIEREFSPEILQLLRSINNVVLFSATAIILSLQIKKQQGKLEASEAQYRNLFESNPNPMWIYHKKTLNFIAINDAAVAKYGYSRSEFLRMSIWDIRPSTDYNLLDKVINDNDPGIRELGVWKHLKKSGEIISVSITSHEVVFNEQTCQLVKSTDVTDILKNEEKLQEAYQKEKELNEKLANNYELVKKAQEEGLVMAQVINKINNLVLLTGEDGLIFWVNKAFTDFTGYTLNDVVGKRPAVLHGPKTDYKVLEELIESLKKKAFFSNELANYKRNGEIYWTQLNISSIFDEDGSFKFYISVQNIITERKEKEQKILAQHAALQEIAWSNSHELRRPVSSILGLIAIIKSSDDEEEIRQCITLLDKCSIELDCLLKCINQKVQHLELNETLKA